MLCAVCRVPGGHQRYREALSELGLTYPQYVTLLALWEKDGETVSALGTRFRLDSGTVSPLLKRLEVAGLVERRRSSDDERRVTVHLTPRGETLRAQAEQVQRRALSSIDLSPSEIDTLRTLARRLSDSVAAERCPPGLFQNPVESPDPHPDSRRV